MTPTPKDPVAPLMALVDKYGESCRTYAMGAHSAHSIKARAAVEASARALAAVPARNVMSPEVLIDGNAESAHVQETLTPSNRSRSQQAGGVPAGFVLAGWLREWEGDESDIGQWLFVEHEHEKDDSPNWHPVYWLAAAPKEST